LEGGLLVCHAAPPLGKDLNKKSRAICLYGHTTGKTTEEGFPERLDWTPSYDKKEGAPFVVYGHVTFKTPYLTKNTCGIDTGCFAGNALSAIRFPEKEIVSVTSTNSYEGVVSLKDPAKLAEAFVEPTKITTLQLPELLKGLKEDTEKFLRLVDQDSELMKKECGRTGLVIANAKKDFFDLEYEHQLIAKGLIYTRNPYRLVAVPLVKMFNWSMHPKSDALCEKLEKESKVVYPEKLDGTCIIVTEHEGEVYFATRSVLEGCDLHLELGDDEFPYIKAAREVAARTYPCVLDPVFVKNKTLVFELIHPVSRIVTKYHDKEDLILISVFDMESFQYWSHSKMQEWSKKNGLKASELLVQGIPFKDGVDRIRDLLADDPNLPEGAVICFEKDDQIIHRVKVKMEEYLTAFSLRYDLSFSNVVRLLWLQPEYQNWDVLSQYLMELGLHDEELLHTVKGHFDEFHEWQRGIYQRIEDIKTYHDTYVEENPKESVTPNEWFKKLADHLKKERHEDMGLVMSYARNKLNVRDVAKKYPPCGTFGYVLVLEEFRDKDRELPSVRKEKTSVLFEK
jgi:hypothetical protein